MANKGFKIPLSRVAQQSVSSTRGVSGTLTVENGHNYAYMAYISVGGQNLSVILDSGSSDLWVVSSECSDSDCQRVVTYNRTSTFLQTDIPFKLKYLMGSVSGSVAFETIALGPYRISSQVFAVANSTTGLGMSNTGHSGIIGLAFTSEASIPSTCGQPFLRNLASYFPEDQRYFAIKLDRDDSSSTLTFGELDSSYANSTEDLHWTNVYKSADLDYDYWKLPLRTITVNGTVLPELSPSKVKGSITPIAVLDSGTTLILGPVADVDYFWNSVGGARKDEAGQWQVLCNRGLIVRIALGDESDAKEYVLDPQDVSWMDGGRQGDWCMGGIQGNDGVNSGDWLFGDVFLRNVYAVHQLDTVNSPPQIGLVGTTDSDSAMALFTRLRGGDDSIVGIHLAIKAQVAAPSPNVIYGMSIAGGFIVGTALALVLLLRRDTSRLRRRNR